MTLDPRALAVQGIGFASRVLAVQGFLSEEEKPALPPIYLRPSASASKKKKVVKRKDTDDDVLMLLM